MFLFVGTWVHPINESLNTIIFYKIKSLVISEQISMSIVNELFKYPSRKFQGIEGIHVCFKEAKIWVVNPNQEMFVEKIHNGLNIGYFNEYVS